MNTALIVAAGSGTRAKLSKSKILYPINGKPLFMYSVDTFFGLGFDIVLVVSKDDYQEVRKYISDDVKLVIGGKTRSESVMLGLKSVITPYVYIHDAARPLVSKSVISDMEKALEYHDAVLLAEKVTSALKKFENNKVISENRESYLLAQTPQAFLTEKIRYAHIRNDKSYDDDISLYQNFYPDDKVHVVINEENNIKVTYPEDILFVKQRLERDDDMRIGHSFDIHQLAENRKLILGGIEIPHDKGLLGHSDADVLLHAITEAMLGALALGDLGTYFPDTDQSIKDIDSSKILIYVYNMIREKGYEIGNIDATVYAELPKLNPHIQNIRDSIASKLHIPVDKISVKATTYEKMDAIGEKKAIAAEAVVMLKKVTL
jgi:2-C-methyl-D-erythritol 4-phosphate cytidylyltransferase/2-C-methyl-D-erythritol 4-phosphate cytidylyltransferase/2-C-methyl-D-erythritol 2,4-cyclodiphosphate synthase